MAIVDHGDGIADAAEREGAGAIAGDGIGACPGGSEGQSRPVLIEIIDTDIEVAGSVGGENNGLREGVGGGPGSVYSGSV